MVRPRQPASMESTVDAERIRQKIGNEWLRDYTVTSRRRPRRRPRLAYGLTDEENGRLSWSADLFDITAFILASLERRLVPAPTSWRPFRPGRAQSERLYF